MRLATRRLRGAARARGAIRRRPGGCALSLLVLVSAGCASGRAATDPAAGGSQRAVVELASESFSVDGAPWGVAVDGRTIWVSNATQGGLIRIDAVSGDVIGEVASGATDARDAGLAISDGQLWVANLGGTVGVVDTGTNQPVARASTGDGEPAAVTLDDHFAWVPTHGPGGGLVRLDRSDPARDPLSVTLPESGFAAAVSAELVWVAGLEGRVFAVDVATGDLERTVDVGGAPRGIALADGDVWVSLRDERAIARIDPGTGEVIARVDIGGQPWPIAAGPNILWVATLDGQLLGIDPSSNVVTHRATVRADPRAIAVADGFVWVTSQRGAVTRVSTS